MEYKLTGGGGNNVIYFQRIIRIIFALFLFCIYLGKGIE